MPVRPVARGVRQQGMPGDERWQFTLRAADIARLAADYDAAKNLLEPWMSSSVAVQRYDAGRLLGTILWDDTVRLGIELRKKLRVLRREYEQKEADQERRWFFEPFVPDVVSTAGSGLDDSARDVPWESLSTDELASDPRYWAFAPGAAWHGFGHVAADFAMTDPNKLIILTPGFDGRTGGVFLLRVKDDRLVEGAHQPMHRVERIGGAFRRVDGEVA